MSVASAGSFTFDQMYNDLSVDRLDVGADIISKARSGDGQAFNDIGYLYQHKKGQNAKALVWYRLAADKNNPSGLNNLGYMYHYGKSVPQDYHTAMDLYLRAAKFDRKRAFCHIGELLENGHGVEVDRYKALEWYRKYDPSSAEAKKLKSRGYHIAKHIKDKPIESLIQETRSLINGERTQEEPNKPLPRVNSTAQQSTQSSYARLNSYDRDTRSITSVPDPRQDELESLRLINEQFERETRNMRNEAQLLQQKINSLEDENRRLQSSSSYLDKQIEDLKFSSQSTDGDMKLLKQSYKVLEQHLSDKDHIIASLQQENRLAHDASRNDQHASQKAIEALEMLLDSKKSEVDLLKQNFQLLSVKDDKKTVKLIKEIERLKTQIEHDRTLKPENNPINDEGPDINYDSESAEESGNDLNYDSDTDTKDESAKKPKADAQTEIKHENDLNYDG